MTENVPIIPRDVLFGNPTRDSPLISPDGERLAFIAPVNGVLNVWVGSAHGDDAHPVTSDTDRGVRHYFWSFDNRSILYVQDVGGDENWLLYLTDIVSGETTCLTPFENVQVQIVEYDKKHPDTMILAINKDNEAAHDAYRLNLTNGDLVKVGENPGNIVGWIPDTQLNVRAAQAANEAGGFDLLVRDKEDGEWRKLVEWSAGDSLTSAPLAFTASGEALFLIDSRDWNAGRLVSIDARTGETTVLAQDEQYDAGTILQHPDTYEVQMVSFTRARREWVLLDDSLTEELARITSLNPGDFVIYDRTVDDRIWLIGYTQDDGPVAYYRWDRDQQAGTLLFHNRPELSEAPLAHMQPITVTSRDGLTLEGYLTKPVDAGDMPLPLVLNVHGGPWARDTWGYKAEPQWLANRGYACLQINFRGSTGYGKDFLNAGDREWGGRMQDDLVDAVQWAIDEGIADPERVAIYGGSYGGYAALTGATRDADVFTCAVDIVGVSNLLTFIDSIPPYWSAFLEDLYRRVGHPERDRDFLIERSPLTHVDKVRCPMLIAQGANDPRVKQAESEQFVEALTAKSIDHEYLLFEDEGHGFAKPENNLTFYAAAERFLARHLGGRCED